MKTIRGMEDKEGLAARLIAAARDISNFEAGYRPSASEVEKLHTIMQWRIEYPGSWVIWGKLLDPGKREYEGGPIHDYIDVLFYIDVENRWALTLNGFLRLQDDPEGPLTDAWNAANPDKTGRFCFDILNKRKRL